MISSTFNDVLAALGRSDAGLTFGRKNETSVTYAELARLVRGNAAHFAAKGVRRGDRVAIAFDTDLPHVVAFLALVARGAIPVSLKPRRGSVDEYRRTLAELLPRFHVEHVFASLAPYVHESIRIVEWTSSPSERGLIEDVDPHDVAFVQFSSGSLGDPKAIPIRHANLVDNLASIFEVDGRTPETKGVCFLPLSHDMGLVGGLLSNLVFENPLRLVTVGEFLRRPVDVLADSTGTAMPDFAMRTLARRMASTPSVDQAFASLRTIYCGAEPISARTVRAFLDVAAPRGLDPSALVFAYGLAEATLMVTARRYDDRAFSADARPLANVGAPRRGTEIAIAEGGNVLVRGAAVIDGYLDEPRRDSAWLDTGDLGRIDERGDLAIVGRAKELVIVNGENLFPIDIEDRLSRAPGVAEPLVMGDGDRFYVYVVPTGNAPRAEDLASLVAAEFGAAPAAIAFGGAEGVLRTTSGKAMRAATLRSLRERGVLEERE